MDTGILEENATWMEMDYRLLGKTAQTVSILLRNSLIYIRNAFHRFGLTEKRVNATSSFSYFFAILFEKFHINSYFED